MHILISGGSGFIGAALCQRLTAAGHTVTVLSRRPEQVPGLCGAGVQGVRELSKIPPATHIDAVINLAGASIAKGRWTEARKRELVDSRVHTTQQLVEFMAARENRPTRFISGSAVGFYGAQGEEPLHEDSEAVQEFQHELCRAWETAADQAQELGISTAIIRLGIVLGPGGGALANMLPPFRFGLGGPIGSGRQWMSWVHRDDVLGALEMLLTRPDLTGPFNLTAPNPVTNAVFSQTLGKALHRPAFLPMPGFVLRLLLGEFAHLLITGQRVIPRNLTDAGFSFRFPELQGALADILGKR